MARRKRAARAAEQAVKKHPKAFLTLFILALVIAVALVLCWYFFIYRKDEQSRIGTLQTGELEIHFLELGNRYTGDCIFLRTGDVDILIDGGSREDSAETIEAYVDRYCTDGVLEYVIVTHADRDHIAAFAGNNSHESLFRRYECRTIIDFPRTEKDTQVYRRYLEERAAEEAAGAAHYTALECWENQNGAQRSYRLGENITLNFLYNYYYENDAANENDYSVCFTVAQGDYTYLFTGDLESKGEHYLVEYNDLSAVKLYKAGHHGSKTSSGEELLSVIRPEYVCVCCCAGSDEYTDNGGNTFPTQDMIDRVAKYTKNIFVTTCSDENSPAGHVPMNGTIVVKSDGIDFTVTGTNNSLPLKETDWFKANRTWRADGVV